ncbi:unnamed protein product [Staurois parvus]|uniref:Uncharacterized protein n=1 Tax=Staurois parvus TaxID=386267 RepID=A0ABN9AVP2_9NEOB|nr:unnamed protein product [Staurois parvus]
MLSLVCIAREVFLGGESKHRAIQHCPDRGQGFCNLLELKENSSYKL